MSKSKIFVPIIMGIFSSTVLADSNTGEKGDWYESISIEHFDLVESVDFQERDFVKEKGFQISYEKGYNRDRKKNTGLLKSYTSNFQIGYLDYKGGSQVHNVAELSSKTLYINYDSSYGRGYRKFLSDRHSIDVNGYLGYRLINRAILNRDVYSNTENKEVTVGAYEFYAEIYAQADIGYNYHYNKNNQLSLKIGTDYPIKTVQYSNNTSKLLYPEPTFSLMSSISYHFDNKYLTAYYKDSKYDASDANSEGWFQPETEKEIIGLEFGWYL